MKKSRLKIAISILTAALVLALLAAVLVACAPHVPEEVRTVTFMNGDQVYDTQRIKLGEKYSFPQQEPTLEQPDDEHLYEFLGWTLDANFYEYRSEILSEPDYVVADVTLFAAYRLVTIDESEGKYDDLEYKVEFRMPTGEDFGEMSGTTLERYTQTVKRHGDAQIPASEDMPEITGYHFTGKWDGGSLQDVRGNRRVTAVYEKNVYSLTWHYLGETSTRELRFRDPVDLTEQPQVDEAFVFVGWYTDPEFNSQATLSEIPDQNVDLYAKYRVDFSTATVSFEGSLVYGDIRNNLYINGLKECDDLVYTFQWTINGDAEETSGVRFREVKNAGDYNVVVRIFAAYKGDILHDEGNATTEQGSEQFVYTVEKATLTAAVTLSQNAVVYGEDIPEATIRYSGFVFDETAEGVGVDQDFRVMSGSVDLTGTNLHVGTYRVETLPHELPNYKFADIAAPTFEVTKKNLNVSVAVTSNVYGDGFAYMVSFDGFVDAYGDDENVLGKHWFTLNGDGEYVLGDRIHAGEYSAQLCGYVSNDYNVILPVAETFSVSKRLATAQITAEGGVYGDTPQVSYKLDNVFAEDEDRFMPAYTYTSGGNAYNDISRFVVGNYNVTATFEERGYSDYQTVAVTGDEFEITKRPLNVTVDVQSVYTYGDTVTAKAVYENNFAFDEDENTNGLVRGEISFVWKNAEGTEYRRNNFEAGNYSVVAQGVSALNYEFLFPTTQFVVNRKALVLKVHLQSDSILYGETPRVATDSGYLNGIEYVGFAFDETARSVFGTLPTIIYQDVDGNSVASNFHAGDYIATTVASHKNYSITIETQSFTINRRTLFVNVELSATSLIYGNKPRSTIVYAAENYDGFFGNEKNIYAADAHVVYGGNQTYTQEQLNGTAKMLAGKYVVTVQGIDEGINKDYQVTYQYAVDNLTFTVERAPIQITVSAASDTYTYGVDPALTVATDKFGYGETAQELFGDGWDTVFYTKDGKPATIDGHFGAGEYHATLKDLSNDNYIITISPFDFTVNKADLTVTVNADCFKYGEQDSPVPTLKYEGFVFDEDNKDLDGAAQYNYTKDNVLYEDSVFHAGRYSITVAGYTSYNYEITYVGGEFDVQTRQITLTIGKGWTTYAQDPVVYNWYGIGGDDILGGESKELTFFVSITRNGDKYVQGSNKYFPHGDYVVTVTHSDNGDYTVTGGNTLTFTVAKLTYNLNVSGAKKWAERADWSVTPRIPDSADRFTLQGSIVLNDPESVSAGDHSDNEIGKQFVWKNNEYHVYVGDEDVTDNFTFTYTLSVSLSNSDFAVQKPGNLTFTFDGTMHTFAVTATADGISADQITITYDYDDKYSQSQVSIRDVREDNYVVYYTVHAQNAEDATGSFTVIVNKADINVTAPSNITKDYDKQDSFVALKQWTNFFGVEADDEFSATVKYSKDSKDYDQDSLSIVNVKDSGTVNFLVDAGANYNTATGFYEIAINKAMVRLPEIESKTYNGNKQTAGVVATEYYDVSDVGGIDAATYQVVLALKDADNYKWSDGNEERTRKFDFVIARAQLTRPTADNAVYVYTAAEQTYSPDFGEQEVSLFKVDNNVQTNADSYNVTVAITDKINYEWTDGKQDDIEFTFVINKANINVTVPDDVTEDFNNTNRFAEVSATGVEGDDEFEPTVTYGRSDSLCDQPSLNLTNVADSGAVYFKVTAGDNYNEATGSYNVTINPIDPHVNSVIVDHAFDFDVSNGKGVVAITKQQILQHITSGVDNLYRDTYEITCSVTKDNVKLDEMPEQFVHAGTYVVTITIQDVAHAATIATHAVSENNNYNMTSVTYAFTINKRVITVTLPNNVKSEYSPEKYYNDSINVDNLGNADKDTLLNITYAYDENNGYAKYDESSVVPVFTDATIGDINVQVKVSLNENSEYVDDYVLILPPADNMTYTINIAKATISSTQGDVHETYEPNENRFVEINKGKIQGILGDEDVSVTYKTDLSADYSAVIPQIINATTGTTVYFCVVVNEADGTPSPNYNVLEGASYKIIIDKADYTADYVNAKMPTIEAQINQMGKTLAKVALSNGFCWENESESLQLGTFDYGVIYSEGNSNYNDYRTTLTFETVKEKISLSWNHSAFVSQYNGDPSNNVNWWDHVAVIRQNDGNLTSGERSKFAFALTFVNYKKELGGTYEEKLVVTFTENDYFELTSEKELSVVVKIQTVQWNGKPDEWYTIEDALAAANKGTITVKYNTSFADKETAKLAGYCNEDGSQKSEYYTVQSGTTLFLPYDSTQDSARGVGSKGATNDIKGLNGTTQTNKNQLVIGVATFKDLELTVPAYISITNKGTLNIGGITSGGSGGTSPAGQTCSGYAQLTMGNNSVLDSYGNITSRGFIMEQTKGNGSKLIMNSGTLNIPFVVVEHRGGTKFSNIYDYMAGSPFNRFYLQNVTCTYEIRYGATVQGHANMYASSRDQTTDVKFIGADKNHFIQLASNSYVVAKYDVTSKVTKWDIYGTTTINALTLSISVATLSTSGVMFPISWYHNLAFHTVNGQAAMVTATAQDMKILPGGAILIDQNVTFKVTKLFVYDSSFVDPMESAGVVAAPKYETVNGAGEKLEGGKLVINGTLEARELGGNVETTQDGATLKITTAYLSSFELINADSVLWKTFNASVYGRIWNNNGTLSSTQKVISAGTYNSMGGGWITSDSKFSIEYQFGYRDDQGSVINPEDVRPDANNPSAFSINGMKLQDATLDGYEFVGWFTDSDFTNPINEIPSSEYKNYLSVNSKLMLYGLFRKLPDDIFTYSVVLNANAVDANIGGSDKLTVNIRSDRLDEFSLANHIPTRQYYNFLGWTKEIDGVDTISSLTATDFTDGTVNLYAKWEVKTFTITVTKLTLENSAKLTIYVNEQQNSITKANQSVTVPAGATVRVVLTIGSDTSVTKSSTPSGLVTESGTEDTFTMPEQNVTLTVEAEDTGFCLAEGTMVWLANGTQKKVEDLTLDDEVLVFNHITGKFEASKLLFNAHANLPAAMADLITLKFADGTKLKIINEHALFDLDIGGYVFLNVYNYKEYMGHRFASVEYVNGEFINTTTKLVGAFAAREMVKQYSPVSIGHLNMVAEGMLALTAFPGQVTGFVNYFEYENGTMKYDEEKMQEDIQEYGLYTYEDFKNLMPEEMFHAAPWAYFKVAVGKGMLTWDDIVYALYYIYETTLV